MDWIHSNSGLNANIILAYRFLRLGYRTCLQCSLWHTTFHLHKGHMQTVSGQHCQASGQAEDIMHCNRSILFRLLFSVQELKAWVNIFLPLATLPAVLSGRGDTGSGIHPGLPNANKKITSAGPRVFLA